MVCLFIFKQMNRKPYLLGSMICLLILWASMKLPSLESLVMLMALGLAVWYLWLTFEGFSQLLNKTKA